MTARVQRRFLWGISVALATLAAACGEDNGSPPVPTATAPVAATVTLTPVRTATPPGTPASGISGLVVVNRNVAAPASDQLGTPPPGWAAAPDAISFDRALGNADWVVNGAPDTRGVTGGDGRFEIAALPPGHYTLDLTKTLDGNLLPLQVPFTVGDDGRAEVVAEVSWGLVRATSTYTENGAQVSEVHAPNGSVLVVENGRVREIGDTTRTLDDPDADGQFDVTPCLEQVWSCGADRSCSEGRTCVCTSSCPVCDDCGPGLCVPPVGVGPYRCNADGTCAQAADQCVCASSCPGCKDCVLKVCVPGCAPVEITAVTVSGPTQVRVSQQGSMTANASLSDGSVIDVTYLAQWRSSDETVATIDSWGTVSAQGLGNTTITASVGTLQSALWPLAVVERPALRRIDVQNNSCIRPIMLMNASDPTAASPAPAKTDMLPVPSCSLVVLAGNTLQFAAFGEFEDGSYQDITSEVEWHVDPAGVGTVEKGTFTAVQAGTANLTATLGAVVSDATQVRVVSQPTVVGLTIYADNGVLLDGGPVAVGPAVPCMAATPAADMLPCCCWEGQAGMAAPCRCGYTLTVLRGDQLRFHATAQYDTGDWRDVTKEVTWRSSEGTVATIDASGVMTALQGGDTTIDAVLGDVNSNQADVHVVNEATLQSIYIYQEGGDRVVAKGDQRFFKATGNYDVGFGRDVTSAAAWHSSDDHMGGFDSPGTFTGGAAGRVEVWAEFAGQQSEHLSLEVYETSELAYCDPNHINRAVWSDDFNRVTLESDCATYNEPGVVTLRYTVTETQPHGGVFNPCLDLYVYQGKTRVRTIREQGCGAPFLAANAPGRDEAVVKYQLRAFWLLKDEDGDPVEPGTYTIYGRFYLYYDPVVSIDVTVLTPNGTPPPTHTPTPAVFPQCTPPLCAPGEVFHCPLNSCPGGCGTVCVTPIPPPETASIALSKISGDPGARVTFAATLQSKGAAVAGAQNDIAFDSVNAPIAATGDGKPDCTVNPSIGKAATVFGFLPNGCSGAACTGMRAIVLSMSNTDPIPDGSMLYECTVSIAPQAPPGLYPLAIVGVTLSDPLGQQVPNVAGSDGTILVSGEVPRTPTPVR
jgi:hypothetical protein